MFLKLQTGNSRHPSVVCTWNSNLPNGACQPRTAELMENSYQKLLSGKAPKDCYGVNAKPPAFWFENMQHNYPSLHYLLGLGNKAIKDYMANQTQEQQDKLWQDWILPSKGFLSFWIIHWLIFVPF